MRNNNPNVSLPTRPISFIISLAHRWSIISTLSRTRRHCWNTAAAAVAVVVDRTHEERREWEKILFLAAYNDKTGHKCAMDVHVCVCEDITAELSSTTSGSWCDERNVLMGSFCWISEEKKIAIKFWVAIKFINLL